MSAVNWTRVARAPSVSAMAPRVLLDGLEYDALLRGEVLDGPAAPGVVDDDVAAVDVPAHLDGAAGPAQRPEPVAAGPVLVARERGQLGDLSLVEHDALLGL